VRGERLACCFLLDLGHYDCTTKRFTAVGAEPQEVTATEAA
jgi:hypothetical protein